MSGCFDRASGRQNTAHDVDAQKIQHVTPHAAYNNLKSGIKATIFNVLFRNANMQNRTVFGECRKTREKKQYLQICESYILLNHSFLVHGSTQTTITKEDPCSRSLWVTGDGVNQKCKEVIKEKALNRSYGVDDE